MIRLDTVNRSLQMFLGAATTSNPLQVIVCYSDQTLSTYQGSTQLSNSNGTTAVTICSAPASGATRDIDMLSVLNTDTVAANVTIEVVDTSTPYQLIYVQLSAQDKLTYTHGSGWQIVTSQGNIKYSVQSVPGVTSFNSRTGVVTLTSSDVTTALTYTPAPQTSGTSLLYGNGSGGFSNVIIGSGVTFSGGTLSATGTGTVTSVALTVPTGFSVTGSPVTSSGTLAISTSLSGIIKGTGSGFTTATSGTDYAPATSGSSILYGNGSGGFSNVTIGSGVSFTAGTLSATGSGGTVTSVGLSLPSIFSVTGSPVTGSGTLTATLASETANTVFAAPNGSSGTPTFRSLVNADFPTSGVSSGTYGSGSVVPVITVNSQGIVTSVTTAATNAPAYQGTWNASTNTPTLTSSVGTQGYYYVVSTAGTTNLDGNAVWVVGDWAIFGNGKWERIPGSASESFTNLTTANLAVTGLTGYMYANGSSNVTSSTTIPTTALSGTITNAQLANSTISGVALGNSLFNLTAGTNVTFSSGSTYNGSTAITINASSTMVYPGAGIPNSTGSAWGTSYSTTGSGTVVALATSPTFVTPVLGTPTSGNFSTGTFTWPTFNQNTTGNAATATLATTATNLAGGAASQIPYQTGSGATSFIANGTTGQVLTSNGTSAPTWTTLTSLVTISDQTSSSSTFYPAFLNATTGTVSVIDTSSTKLQYVPSTGTFTSTVFSGGSFIGTETITGSLSAGAFSYGTLGYSDVNIFGSFTSSVNTYNQIILQNTNSGSAASTDYVVSNNLGTSTTYYGDFGMNSSTFSGTGSLSLANAVYLTATSSDLSIGTTTANPIHFVINGSATDAMTINTSGALALNGQYGTSGQVLSSGGSSGVPTWINAGSGGSSPPALNVTLQQNFGGFL